MEEDRPFARLTDVIGIEARRETFAPTAASEAAPRPRPAAAGGDRVPGASGAPAHTRTAADDAAERQIVEGCQRGDEDAFRRLFELHKDRVYATALHYFGGDEAVAMDVTQHVFLKLFSAIGGFRSESSFSTWLYRIVANACADERRARARMLQLDEGVGERTVAPGESQEGALARRRVEDSVAEAVGRLSPKLRMPILMRYVEGLSYDEIAEALGCSKGTVASRLSRGHAILARELGHLRGELSSDRT